MSSATQSSRQPYTSPLSCARMTRLMSGDKKTAIHMGLWDKFKDLFRTEKKQDALNQLMTLVNSNEPSIRSFHLFNELAKNAAAGTRPLFTVDLLPGSESNKNTVNYCIDGHVIKTETITDVQRQSILALLGEPLDAQSFRGAMASLEDHRLASSPAIADLSDEDFVEGGVHKRFHSGTGVLQAQDATGKDDFTRERALSLHAQDYPDLQCYLSTQKIIAPPHDANRELAYAEVALYDNKHIESAELNSYLTEPSRLTNEEARSVAVQIVDMARALYCAHVSHRDLHMKNLMVYKNKDTGAVHLKAIDFGHAKFAGDFGRERFKDVDYLFNRMARSQLETLTRNYVRGEDSERMQKHYPLHKLLESVNTCGVEVAKLLSCIGSTLKADLLAAENESEINRAFEFASASVQQAIGSLSHPDLGVGYFV